MPGAMIAVFLMLSLTGCKKQKTAPEDAPIQTISTGAAGKVITTHLVSQASEFGFASRIPADVEAYVGTVHVRQHLAALQQTRFYQDLTAYLEDKTPAPSADGKTGMHAAVLPLWSDDGFIAVGKGGAAFFGLAAEMAEANRMKVLSDLLARLAPPAAASAGSIGVSQKALEGVEFPPLLIGLRSDDPEALLKTVISEEQRKRYAKLGPGSTMTLSDGGKFTLHEGKVDALLDSSAEDAGILAVLSRLKGKTFSAAWGSSGGYALLALGNARKALEFAKKPEESVLGRSEWGFLTPQVNDSLLAIGWIDEAVLQAVGSGSKVATSLRGILNAAPSESPLAVLGQSLKDPLDALVESEQRYFERSVADLAFGAWWQQGLRVEVMGGLVPEDLSAQVSLKFGALVDEPQVLYGLNTTIGEGDRERFAEYVEGWGALVREAAKKLLEQKAAAAGQEKPLRQWLEAEVLPPLANLYEGIKDVSHRGLGPERAYLIHLEDPADSASASRPGGAGQPFTLPLLAHLSDVRDRQVLQNAWLKMEPSLAVLAKAFPMSSGQEPLVPDLDTQDGMNIYFLGLPYPSPQLSPCVGVSDRAFLVTSSRALCDELASSLARKPETGDALISQWRLNVPRLRKWIQGAAQLPIEAGTAGFISHWMAPLGDLRGRTSVSNGKVRRQWTWDIQDPRRFD